MATSSERQKVKDITDAFQKLQDVDALGFAIIGAAGVAGYCGVKGPLTSILMGLEGTVSGSGGTTGVSKLLSNPIDTWTVFELTGSTFLAGFIAMFGQHSSSSSVPSVPTSPQEQKAWMLQFGQAASNMVEAGLLYQLARNPETLQTLFDMSKEAVKGAVGLGKGVAALGGV